MSDRPLVSVIMPVYNSERFLARSIESILDQTVHNLELIIINDGSTDNSHKVIQSYMDADQRIVLISRENKGVSVSSNEGIELARGEYIARLDADDISLSHRFEHQLQWMKDNKVDLCGCSIKMIGTCFSRVVHYPTNDQEIKLKLLFGSAFAHSTVIAKAEVFKAGLYDKSIKYAEDYDLWTRLAIQGVTMSNCPEPLVEYRIHGGQATQKAREVLKLRNKVALSYWVALGMNPKFNSIYSLSHDIEFDQMVMQLKEKGLLVPIIIPELWKVALNSCDLGFMLWKRYGSLNGFISIRSFVLLLFCLIGNNQLPSKIKRYLERPCIFTELLNMVSR